ncbi:NADP-dependent malic enzyme [Siccirubricoccus sp. KC 17139]|uniref:NADP-dependent malic enzyme n=1 Tax=Siccirubricoccus soli TaxID=2899147 RepID=A0ABT1D2T3_9PROT|nr:NADP-dependent malic enzyme [Siccirubricoccus soli]MCO6416221.1 NADP-dependent malic enzyme [Siccirubricoccus soli]MCP2682355.1 NADP-dependent malic enzyme [Siccirubricoccus soli]
MDEDFRRAALDYHRFPRPGKLAIEPTKRMATQRDLALAYSPGVAAACEEIAANPDAAWDYTARGNVVAVISNGTAVLGLGAIGALAGKPVMEGKAVLFKKFAGIDSIDIEVEERDPQKLIEVIAALEPSFGAINLEDIKAPECFEVERVLRERMRIPVFHDDQHGTAIIVAAAVRNGLVLQGKRIEEVKLVNTGGGAAALACLDLLVEMGLRRENVTVCDINGVVHTGRNDLDPYKAKYARETAARTLEEVLEGADIFLGLSAPRVLKPEWLGKLAPKPLVLALANPEPEILPEAVRAARPDAIVATGRSDYPNQVNNVLCFPFIFRGALDVGATAINEAMKVAAADAIAALARVEASEVVAAAYGGHAPVFGPDYIIPRAFDPRLILEIAPAVARAAMETGVARRPIADFAAYRRELERFVFRSGYLMRPMFEAGRQAPRRVAYAEGEDERTLRAVQTVLDEGIAEPVLIGRREVIEARARAMGLRMDFSQSVEILDPNLDRAVFEPLISLYQKKVARRGVPPEAAARRVGTRAAVTAAVLLEAGLVDAALVGGSGNWMRQWHYAYDVIGKREDAGRVYALSAVIIPTGTLFFVDTHLLVEPSAEQIAEMTLLAAEQVHAFGITPKVALLSHSSFGASHAPTARTMRAALGLIRERAPGLEVDGEMHADAALVPAIRARAVPESTLSDTANLLVFPNLDSANISFNLLKAAADGLQVGPILLGMRKPIHVLVPSVTARGIVNLTAVAVHQANALREEWAG